MSRRTKILATLGPASESPEVIRGMIRAGMDAVRLNLSHGSVDGAVELHRRVRAIAAEEGREIGTLVDLPGPKVRAASFGRDGVDVAAGDVVRFEQGATASTRDVVRVAAEGVVDGLQPGDRVSFGDGGIVATVVEVAGGVVAHVIHGGHLSGSPGVHVPAERLKINTPTPEDLRILDRFVEEGVDMIAVSFVRSAHDIRRLGTEPHPRGPLVVAKIETHAAVENLAGILDVTGAVMIARGDLGIEFPIEEVPHLQKEIVRACIGRGCPAITATQMLESMVHAPTPTRAEATDVANAVFDGTSVVMLSGETAVGDDPVNVVATMSRLCQKADEAFDAKSWMRVLSASRKPPADPQRVEDFVVTDSMTKAATRVAEDLGAEAILCITRSGRTVRAMARFRPEQPILGFSPDERVRRQLSVSWGSTPLPISSEAFDNETMVKEVVETARREGFVRQGDQIVVLAGVTSTSRATDVLRAVRVP
ncbi:MAG: pyruvate kinase [Thermoleophilia bacterium]|nr:pyruvate kinase [Thermoleophilia bacterium]